MTATVVPPCSVLSLTRDEPMLGTAFAEPGVLLVEQPGPWGHAGLADSRFDAEVAARLKARTDTAGLRLLAVRRYGRTLTGPRRQWAIRPPGSAAVYWSSFAEDAELLDVPLTAPFVDSSLVADREPLYLVCAHSKRDVCCAVRGRPVAAALAALRPGQVWECSHTGGHRFAPIVLTLPAGALYGRLPLERVGELVDAAERAELVPDLLRGVIGHPPVDQAALAAAQQQLGILALDGISVLDSAEGEDGRWTVRLAHGTQQYDVDVRVELSELSFVSCGKPALKRERHYLPGTVIPR